MILLIALAWLGFEASATSRVTPTAFCEQVLANYSLAVTELARGFISLEAMEVEGRASGIILHALKEELENKKKELTSFLGEEKFNKIFEAELAEQSNRIHNEKVAQVESRKNSVEQERSLWQPWQFLLTLKGPEKTVNSVAYSPDGTLIAGTSDDGTVRVWDAATSEEKYKIKVKQNFTVETVQFSPNGETLLFTSNDGYIHLWNFKKSKISREIEVANTVLWSARFNNDGSLFATTSTDRVLRIWDTATGKSIRNIDENSKPIIAIDFSPDGQSILGVYDDGVLKIWSVVRKDQKTKTFQVKNVKQLNFGAFSPDGKLIAVASHGAQVILLNAETGEQIYRMNGHSGSVTMVRFSPDGRLIASAGSDTTVRIWSVNSGDELYVLENEHENSVNWVEFHPSGHQLVSGSSDNTAVIWNQELSEEP